MSGVYLEASRDSRYSGARKGIGTSGGIGELLACVGAVLGVLGGIRRYIGGIGGLAGTLGAQEPEGYRGIREYWGS